MTLDLERFLLQHIPIASHMQLKVAHFTEQTLEIAAPLAPNTNDKHTAFAGSLFSTMVLAGWLYVTARLKREDLDAEAVAAGAQIQYLKPVTSDFTAVCRLADPADWALFVTKLKKRKNYKLSLPIEISVNGETKVRLTGDYHAWMRREDAYGEE